MTRPDSLAHAVVLIDGFDPRAVLPATGPHPAFRDADGVPAADALFRHLAGQGITDVWLVSRALPGMVVHYFGDGSRWGVSATHVRQDGSPGSGGALSAVRRQITESTLVIDGALVTDLELGAMFEAHRSADADLTMCLTDDVQETAGLPRALTDSSSPLVQQVLTDPPFPANPEILVGVGVYIVEPEAVEPLQTAGVNADWVTDVLPDLARQSRVRGWQANPGARFDLPRRVRVMHSQTGRALPTT
ncbi:MAG: sugar phosphate nucleotidyltransferase [Chloroflexi bacterium]|nr:sugar phosphate nucleotidyltransferase [Chloroflexota bacterium]